MDDIMQALETHTASKRQPSVPSWIHKVHDYVLENFRDPEVTSPDISPQ